MFHSSIFPALAGLRPISKQSCYGLSSCLESSWTRSQMDQPVSLIAENAHLCFLFIVAYSRTRDFAEAADAANHAARHLTDLSGELPYGSPLSPTVNQLRSIVQAACQRLSRQQQPSDLEQGLELATQLVEQLKDS